jgi:hypothetical protein
MTTTPNKGYPQPVINGSTNVWGTLLNQGFLMVDLNLGGVTQIAVAGSTDVTVTTSQAQNLVLQLVGTITANINVYVPAEGSFYIIDNQSAGSFSITVKSEALTSTGVVIPSGAQLMVYCDGTNIHGLGVQLINTGTGLTGGPITQSGTISLAPIASPALLANVSGASAAPVPTTVSALLDAAIGTTRGALIVRGASSWGIFSPGVNGQVLQTSGAGADPIWATLSAIPATGVLADLASTTFYPGDMIYYSSTGHMVRLPAGTVGQVLMENGSLVPTWSNISPSGIVPDYIFQTMGIR